MIYRHSIGATSYVFDGLRDLHGQGHAAALRATAWPGSPPTAPSR